MKGWTGALWRGMDLSSCRPSVSYELSEIRKEEKKSGRGENGTENGKRTLEISRNTPET